MSTPLYRRSAPIFPARVLLVAAMSLTGFACNAVFGLEELRNAQPGSDGGTSNEADARDADASMMADATPTQDGAASDSTAMDGIATNADGMAGQDADALVMDVSTNDVATTDVVSGDAGTPDAKEAGVTCPVCGPHQTCQIDGGTASCKCNATICSQLGTVCADQQSVSTCARDGEGCLYASQTTACASPRACSGMAPGAACSLTCTDSCTQGQKFCVTGGLATCTLGTNGCWAPGAASACGSHQACTGAAGSAACTCRTDAVCTTAGSTCASSSQLATCATDGQGCVYQSATTSCASGVCTGQACCVANACGGCGALAGQPNSNCGECGAYACTTDKSAVICNDPHYLKVTKVAAGRAFTCVLLSSGGVRCFGENIAAELGYGTGANRLFPPADDALAGAKDISAGSDHACAVLTSGALKCWGSPSSGKLGVPGADGVVPVTVDGLPSLAGVAVGEEHTCVLTAAGGVRCWGQNGQGQLGIGTTDPLDHPPSSDVLTNVVMLAVGQRYTCAVQAGGKLQCWGDNAYGELGDGTMTEKYSPTPILDGVLAVATAGPLFGDHTCALLTSGAVRCWGLNTGGSLGDGTKSMRSSPGSDVLSGATAIGVGPAYSCAVVGGNVRCWGANDEGQLGLGMQPTELLAPGASALGQAVSVSGGGMHACAVLVTGEVRCWGRAAQGQLGDGDVTGSTPRWVPVQSAPANGARSCP